ncbi:MAG: hypothetical protein A2539_09775 [Elusimicrobia bacterium RIFOXYD2_FULL_34_15]|nr:MAG: hypothetical protein A2539_09775 [Elusimicrobia bacterium RIFOXYD2_FULL_34_15]
MYNHIINEMKKHFPFTAIGAVIGIVFMYFSYTLSYKTAYNIFYILHPLHVLLSALVTASMYEFYKKGKINLLLLLFVGYVGSVGIATLSDSLIPYFGEILLDMPNRKIHLGFIEKWWLVNPLALIGIAIAYFKPSTKFPHMGHVLVSTWASVFHIIMAIGKPIGFLQYAMLFTFLFLAVWVPCCMSDIVFPLLFVKDKHKL